MPDDGPLLSAGDVRRLTGLAVAAPGAVQAGLIGPRQGPGRSTSQVEFVSGSCWSRRRPIRDG
jgi:hypothetical protein